MIHVVAEITIAPGARERFVTAFRALEPLVRAEDGCIEYVGALEIQTAISAQASPRPDVLTVIEKWESEAALAAHIDAPHMHAHRDATTGMTLGTVIRVLSSICGS